MSTKYRVKMNKLGEMMNDLLIKVSGKKEIYNDVFKLREKHDEICSLVKNDKLVSSKQAKYFMALAFKKKFKEWMMILMNGIGQRLIFKAQPQVEKFNLELNKKKAASYKQQAASNKLLDNVSYII